MTASDHELARLFERPEEKIDLGLAALLLARTEFPELDLAAQVARLDALAAEAAPYLASQVDPAGRVNGLRCFLADICGFHGNEQDYYDPGNSFLNLVLERRTGIPITLSLVYMEVGRRLGLTLYGIGLPGHFLVKYQEAGRLLFLDPFHGGRTMTGSDCREMVNRMYEGKIPFQEAFLAAVDKRYILLRMANNLRAIYLRQRQFRKVLTILEIIVAISPGSSEDLKQRGLIHYQLQNYKQARRDLEACLRLDPPVSDSQEVQQILAELRKVSAMMN